MNEIERFPSEPPPSDIDPLGLELDRPDDERVFAFIRSMPMSYRRIFDEDAQHEHAAVVHRRGDRASHIEIWRKLPERIVAVVVVADDRPGLLSRVSAALVAHDIDVVAAQAFGRIRQDGEREAVDLGLDPPARERSGESPVHPHARRRCDRRDAGRARPRASELRRGGELCARAAIGRSDDARSLRE